MYPRPEDKDFELKAESKSKVFTLLIFLVFVVFIIAMLSGCAKKEPCEPKIVTEYKTIETKVPVMVEVPEIDCDFSGEGIEPTQKLLECVILQKRVLDNLRQASKTEIKN